MSPRRSRPGSCHRPWSRLQQHHCQCANRGANGGDGPGEPPARVDGRILDELRLLLHLQVADLPSQRLELFVVGRQWNGGFVNAVIVADVGGFVLPPRRLPQPLRSDARAVRQYPLAMKAEPPRELAQVNCVTCLDSGWVCEDHPDRPSALVSDSGCECGGAAVPCACNRDAVYVFAEVYAAVDPRLGSRWVAVRSQTRKPGKVPSRRS
ncbi:hypothetical protein H6P1_00062 (plasmid) [Variovorax sp. PBL-H6]|nr:hypothetical protein H6P1_00062 [Variovorax sp. PBL-H6]VTU44471.1 hypothetical protein SRS16P1_00840 [Variovorax sp. SRS16]VTU44516.1 hypothetical protein E5P1_00833 [Variovorax sp. PBL-E5]